MVLDQKENRNTDHCQNSTGDGLPTEMFFEIKMTDGKHEDRRKRGQHAGNADGCVLNRQQ